MEYKIEINYNPSNTKGYALLNFLEALGVEYKVINNNNGRISEMNIKAVLTAEFIQKKVCEKLGVDEALISSKDQRNNIVEARQIAHAIARDRTYLSLKEIGKRIGNRDHSTVLHSCRTVSNLLETDKKYKAMFEEIINEFV